MIIKGPSDTTDGSKAKITNLEIVSNVLCDTPGFCTVQQDFTLISVKKIQFGLEPEVF